MSPKDQVNMSIGLYRIETKTTEKIQKLEAATTESDKSKLGLTRPTPASGWSTAGGKTGKTENCIIGISQPRETLSWRTSIALDAKQDASCFSILCRNANPEANSAAMGSATSQRWLFRGRSTSPNTASLHSASLPVLITAKELA